MKSIEKFSGEYRWLSNFWPAEVMLDGVKYPTVEHAYQAAKTTDEQIRAEIQVLPTPGRAKRARVELRPDWEEIKVMVMSRLLVQKFSPGSDLGKQLVATGYVKIIEGNKWKDTFWGVCDGIGKNHLGRLLMAIRRELRK